MQTIIEQWRNEEIEELRKLYATIETALGAYPEGMTQQSAMDIASCLGLRDNQYEASDGRKVIIFDLVDEKLEITAQDIGYDYQIKELKGWQAEIEKPSHWERFREVDHHIIHMHMKRLHGDKLGAMIKAPGYAGPLLSGIDVIETDALSIHILAKKCRHLDDSLEIDSDADDEARFKAVQTALNWITNRPENNTILPGTMRRGINVTGNYKSDTFVLEGDQLRIKIENLPETLKQENVYIGRPMHDLVDIDGFHSDDFRIRGMSRRAHSPWVTFIIDRTKPKNRRAISKNTGPVDQA